jgi:hypothetical protein
MFSLKLGLNSCAKSFCLANWLSGCLNFRQKSSQNSMPSFASENNLILKFVNRKNAYHSIRLLFFLSFFLSLSLSLSVSLSLKVLSWHFCKQFFSHLVGGFTSVPFLLLKKIIGFFSKGLANSFHMHTVHTYLHSLVIPGAVSFL